MRNIVFVLPKQNFLRISRFAICKSCRFETSRDSIDTMNIWLKAFDAYTGMSGSPQAPSANSETRGRGWKWDEGEVVKLFTAY
ncbi:MAG: hypothetical protein LM582_08560 [Desulfurococcaceae archaeon]|nr:hypothetical protein [Desulfurococcaceae archaeon]